MNLPIFKMLAGIIFNNPNVVIPAIMVHVVMSIVYALVFVVLIGKK